MANRRAWIAAILAFVQPGLGHVYLREWLRAFAWFGLWAGAVALVVPSTAAAATWEFLFRVAGSLGELPLSATLGLTAISVFCTLDAYWLAVRETHQIDETPTCPHCGREVDPSLSFCQWCTSRFDEEEPTSR